jgi:uracil-DNA glycosylase family 4
MIDRVPCQPPNKTPCKIALLGEAPGYEESIDLKPFVGPSGQELNRLLDAARINREDCLVTNVFDTQAPDNNVNPWMKDIARVEENFARLSEEFATYKPTVIVPLGATALWAVARTTAIAAHRGAVATCLRLSIGTKMVPTFHPAAVMRFRKMFPVVVKDLMKAQTEADLGPQLVRPKVQLLIEPTVGDIRRFADECYASTLLSTDIETGWGQITCIGFAPTPERAMCIPFLDVRRGMSRSYWHTADEETSAWMLVQAILNNPVPKVFQNGLYDIAWLRRYGLSVVNYAEDTRLMHHALYPELPKDLGFMGASYTNLGVWKTWGGKQEKRDE